ncbi:MAG TPA: hypothetical protein VK743_21610 [Steroidobacteraceae bacterium]|nr:hypothetical protein [Steroidobacteraceae bacterium]
MIDAEVLRLRKLRGMALRARALAKTLDSDCTHEQSVFARSAVMCWTIARVASGHLRAHPYLSYQQGPSPLDDLADSIIASLVALNARRQNRRLSVYAEHLQNVAREVNDARALTWSPDLSDALGRMQIRMQRLANELELSALGEPGASATQRAKAAAHAQTSNSLDEIAADSSWPYLAI